MNSGQTSIRVYEALRQRVTGRAFRPGARLDPHALADAFGSSVTPVRDALHILIGEGLVETGQGEGFHVPPIDEPGLKDLYDWNMDLLLTALRRRTTVSPEQPPRPARDDDLATRTAMLFLGIARRSSNRVHARAMRWANARLHAVRLVEVDLLPGVADELAALADVANMGDIGAVRQAVGTYHRRRKRAAAKLVRGLYQTGEDIPAL